MASHNVFRAAAAAMLACAPAQWALAAPTPDEVTVALAIPPAVHDGAPYAAAEELGYFSAENLRVRTIVFQGAGALLPQVASKRVTFGYPTSEPVISSYFSGKDILPLRYFYNGVPTNTMEFAVLADSPVQTLAGFKGGKIGVGALTWGTIPGGRAALRTAGLQPGTDVNYVPVGALAAGFQALKTRQVDALNFNSSWNDLLEMSGTPIRRIAYPAVFSETAGNGFIAHVDTFRDQPDLMVRFGRAYTKAQIACEANPAYCVRAYWRANPQARPAPAEEAAALQRDTTLLARRLQRVLHKADGQPRQPGYFDLTAIRAGIQAMAAAGEYPSADVPVDQIFSNAFIGPINQFDADAVRAQAREAK